MQIFSDQTDQAIGQAATRIVVLTDLLISITTFIQSLIPQQGVAKK